ncbi:MAG: hypothetical protein ACI9UT_001260 [Flavobacteriales bacterium]|jgi:hypothetical protein
MGGTLSPDLGHAILIGLETLVLGINNVCEILCVWFLICILINF